MSKQEKVKKRKLNYFFYDFVKVTGVPLMWLFLRPKFIYENKQAKQKIKGGALLISNHSGSIDPIIALFPLWYRRQHFIATKELFNTKVKRWFFTRFHCIEIDRDNMTMDSFKRIISYMKEGKIVSMFPEGRITNTEEVQKFKSGAVLMSILAQRPILPIYQQKRKNIFQRQRIIIGQPIDVVKILNGKPSLSEIDRISELLREKEKQLKEIADGLRKK